MEKIKFLLFIYIFAFNKSLGQYKADTLFFADKKIILQRTKTFFNHKAPIYLPSEYQDLKKEVLFTYNKRLDSTNEISYDENGNQITVLVWGPKDSCKSLGTEKLTYYLNSFLDTIKISVKEFGKQRPYIKDRGKKIYFCYAKIDVDLNDTIFTVIHNNLPDGAIFSHWDDDYRYAGNFKTIEMDYIQRKKATYILKELYYRKGEATYYFDRTFVILLY